MHRHLEPLEVRLLLAFLAGFGVGWLGQALLIPLPLVGPLLGSVVALSAPLLLPLALWWWSGHAGLKQPASAAPGDPGSSSQNRWPHDAHEADWTAHPRHG